MATHSTSAKEAETMTTIEDVRALGEYVELTSAAKLRIHEAEETEAREAERKAEETKRARDALVQAIETYRPLQEQLIAKAYEYIERAEGAKEARDHLDASLRNARAHDAAEGIEVPPRLSVLMQRERQYCYLPAEVKAIPLGDL